MLIIRNVLPVLFLLLILCGDFPVFSGSIEDIRSKSGWQPKNYSERNDAFVYDITPAELISNLDKYHRDKILMKVKYDYLVTSTLNRWVGKEGSRHKWSSKRYVSFSVDDPDNLVRGSNMNFFVNKNSPCMELIKELKDGDKITITGFVRDIDYGCAWIEVKSIKKDGS